MPDGLDNTCEIVIKKDHMCSLFRHFGPIDPHSDANVCIFECRGIVHSIAGHGNKMVFVLQCMDDP